MIRLYTSDDREKLLALLRLNTPQYFDKAEESDFIDYLHNHLEEYYIVEDQGGIIGSGGINYFPDSGLARISWDIIHPDHQGKGIGKKLTLFRVNRIKENPAIRKIVVRTTQLVYKFYEKAGFTLEKTEKDFWAPGFDLYQMQMPLQNDNTTN
ncbi:GNAT family N-acetyltransferase [uncultured Pontibacter sp.]|uniref:GNAT family N-acetyltransferase n=1 Tax=uncultured Pontibacter sp. TaxID=453356 RepID=UPI002629CE2D|nr:GNAT family N-acetyltransferase [uncultured Pontibacter sp.]